ncbi:MAG: hypothetical protein QW727_02530 [Candidatus Pacearchaeota archaeon]
MSLLKNKKGVDLIHETIIFLILNLMFFLALFVVVYRSGTGISLYEQFYSKELALLIDKSKSGTEITLDVSDIEKFLEKENIYENAFSFSGNKVTTRLSKNSKGYSFSYFSDYKIRSAFQRDKTSGKLFLKVSIEKND